MMKAFCNYNGKYQANFVRIEFWQYSIIVLSSEHMGLLTDTSYWWLDSPNEDTKGLNKKKERVPFSIPDALIKKLSILPRREDITLDLYDFDGTLADDQVRYKVDPRLKELEWNEAYPHIWHTQWEREYPGWFQWPDEDVPSPDPLWYRRFAHLLDLKNNLLELPSEYRFDPKNPNHAILSAGSVDFQREKINSAGFGNARKLLVQDASRKPIVILHYLIKLGFIPGKIRFFDDRIKNFYDSAQQISDAIGSPVEYYEAKVWDEQNEWIEWWKKSVAMQLKFEGKVSRVLI